MDLLVKVRTFLKALILFPAIFTYLVHGFLILLFVRDQHARRRMLTQNVSIYSRFALWLMRFKIDAVNFDPKLFERENFLIVCNHLSYLDMLVLSSVLPSVFVTSVDMGEIPFLGQMAEIGGSLFIERRNRDRIAFDVSQIRSVLDDGFNVTLFPEGTSTDGSEVRPFKRSLFQAARDANCRVKPVTLRYLEIDGRTFTRGNHDRVCWYADMSFAPHLLQLLGCRSVRVSVTFHEPIEFAEQMDKHQIAEIAHTRIATGYGFPFREAFA